MAAPHRLCPGRGAAYMLRTANVEPNGAVGKQAAQAPPLMPEPVRHYPPTGARSPQEPV